MKTTGKIITGLMLLAALHKAPKLMAQEEKLPTNPNLSGQGINNPAIYTTWGDYAYIDINLSGGKRFSVLEISKDFNGVQIAPSYVSGNKLALNVSYRLGDNVIVGANYSTGNREGELGGIWTPVHNGKNLTMFGMDYNLKDGVWTPSAESRLLVGKSVVLTGCGNISLDKNGKILNSGFGLGVKHPLGNGIDNRSWVGVGTDGPSWKDMRGIYAKAADQMYFAKFGNFAIQGYGKFGKGKAPQFGLAAVKML